MAKYSTQSLSDPILGCSPRTKECLYCKGSFVHGYGPRRLVKFCSRECSAKYHRFPDQKGSCAQCGVEFKHRTQKGRGRLYCSLQCAGKAKERTGVSNGYAVTRRAGRRVADHVHAAEKALGRRLNNGEVVHHINGNKLDNRNQNLLVCTRGYHIALHFRMSERWQREKFGNEATQ